MSLITGTVLWFNASKGFSERYAMERSPLTMCIGSVSSLLIHKIVAFFYGFNEGLAR